eukprot:TRINITY_DN6742_c0_g1_i8.p1 TRINITY_DN6742_c0_g1~~TRINITY_DN6742_c0_g1_i8.p1  ORF type:complete len:886 (-),score=138.20 TRINITY_DN6742_c0_g1_i8:138-2795(-)
MSQSDWFSVYSAFAEICRPRLRVDMVDVIFLPSSDGTMRWYGNNEFGMVDLMYEGSLDVDVFNRVSRKYMDTQGPPNRPSWIIRHESDLPRLMDESFVGHLKIQAGRKEIDTTLPFCIQPFSKPYMNLKFTCLVSRDCQGFDVTTTSTRYNEGVIGDFTLPMGSAKRIKDLQSDRLLHQQIEGTTLRLAQHLDSSFNMTITGMVVDYILDASGRVKLFGLQNLTWPNKPQAFVITRPTTARPFSAQYRTKKDFETASSRVPTPQVKADEDRALGIASRRSSVIDGLDLIEDELHARHGVGDRRFGRAQSATRSTFPNPPTSARSVSDRPSSGVPRRMSQYLLSRKDRRQSVFETSVPMDQTPEQRAAFLQQLLAELDSNKNQVVFLKKQVEQQGVLLKENELKIAELDAKRLHDADLLASLVKERNFFSIQLSASYVKLKKELEEKERMFQEKVESTKGLSEQVTEKEDKLSKLIQETSEIRKQSTTLSSKLTEMKSSKTDALFGKARLEQNIKTLEKQAGELQASLYTFKEQLRIESAVSATLAKDLATAREQLNRLVHDQLLVQSDTVSDPIHMEVYDLMAGYTETGIIIATLSLQDLVTRHREELFEIFEYYKTLMDTKYAVDMLHRLENHVQKHMEEEYDYTEEEKKATLQGISFDQYVAFAADCRIISKVLNADTLEIAFTKSMHNSTLRIKRSGKVTFNQFVESVVRLSYFKYPKLDSIAASAVLLITTKILPNAHRKPDDAIIKDIESSSVQTSLIEYKTSLYIVFGSLTDSVSGSETLMSFSGALQSLIECGIPDTYLTNTRIHRCFIDSCRERIQASKSGSMQPPDDILQVNFYEWCEFLVRCADIKVRLKVPLAEKVTLMLRAFIPEARKRVCLE